MSLRAHAEAAVVDEASANPKAVAGALRLALAHVPREAGDVGAGVVRGGEDGQGAVGRRRREDLCICGSHSPFYSSGQGSRGAFLRQSEMYSSTRPLAPSPWYMISDDLWLQNQSVL